MRDILQLAVKFIRVVVAAIRRILLRGSRTHAENKHRLRKCPRDVRTRRCCSGHLRKLRKILKCRHLFLTFHAMALFPASGLAPAPMNMRVHRQKRSLQSQEEGSISSPSIRTRAQLLRPRLRSPARRRNSSAEWPGPSNSPSVLANHLALQPSVQLLHGSHQHNRLQRQHDF